MSTHNSNKELKPEECACQNTEEMENSLFPPKPEKPCETVVTPEKCPKPVYVIIGGCKDSVTFDAGSVGIDSLGRILQLTVTLKDICPNKRVALAVFLTEVDAYGKEQERGLKTITVPAHDKKECCDVKIRCIKFVLPEDLDVSRTTDALCNERKFKVRFIANYIDTDFACCDIVL